jgi:nucleotide-binding universal stress UspA family protein
MYKHVMLPVDGSELSLKAYEECLTFARETGARVTILNVVAHYTLRVPEAFTSDLVRQIEKQREQEYVKSAQEKLEELRARMQSAGIQCDATVVAGDSPYEEIIAQAEQRGCDLIMMASHGRRGLDAVLLGSETVKVLTHSKIPVLVVR